MNKFTDIKIWNNYQAAMKHFIPTFYHSTQTQLIKKRSPVEAGGSLQKVFGFWSLFAVGIGCVTAQSSFVSLLNGAGSGGGAFFIAIIIAFFLGLCYCFSFLELSLMMPEAGGPGRYTSVSAGNFISIGVVLGGYIAVTPFATPAELMLLEHVVDVAYPGTFSHLGKVYLNSAIMFLIISAYAFFWVRYKMKKGILQTEHIDEIAGELSSSRPVKGVSEQ